MEEVDSDGEVEEKSSEVRWDDVVLDVLPPASDDVKT